MAKYRSECYTVRRLEKIDIIFGEKNAIYVYYKGKNVGSIFNNWDAPRWSYLKSWKPFWLKLYRQKNLTMARCHEIAEYHGVVAVSTGRRIELKGRKVKYKD